jgi:hypothetical protein
MNLTGNRRRRERWQDREISKLARHYGRYHDRKPGEDDRAFLRRMVGIHKNPCRGERGGCE